MTELQIKTPSDIIFLITALNEMLLKAKRGITVRFFINRKLKSKEQRGYYRAVIVKLLADKVGYENHNIYELELIHEGLKELFCPLRPNRSGMMVKSTELLNTKETEDYHVRCRRFAMVEHGVFVPLPNEDDSEFSQ